jgi:hypothetical protein
MGGKENRRKMGSKKWLRFEVSTSVSTKNVVFWGLKTQFVPQEKFYASAREPSRLMLCKI